MATAQKPDKKDKEEKAKAATNSDLIYKYDAEHVKMVRETVEKGAPVKFFKSCQISALAAMKMLKHSIVGVEEGRKSESKTTFEVLGFLVGKPDGESVVVFDTIPSFAKGFENSVELSQGAMVAAVNQATQLEKKAREEKIIGWYHSHPFDVETYSHCHLSATDVRTQKMQQQMIPTFTAIVVDPLRSLARQEPEFGAFRTYPKGHKPPEDECPDATFAPKMSEGRIKRWGHSSDEYYVLKTTYFMSQLGRHFLGIMSKNNLWVRVLGSTPILETEARQQFSERVRKAAEKLQLASSQLAQAGGRGFYGGPIGMPGGPGKKGAENSELSQGALACAELAIEQTKGHATQVSKDVLFNAPATKLAAVRDKEKEKDLKDQKQG